MRILIVTQYFWPENFRINDLALGPKERGHEVSVFTGKPNYPEGRFLDGYRFFGRANETYEGTRVVRVPRLTSATGVDGVNFGEIGSRLRHHVQRNRAT